MAILNNQRLLKSLICTVRLVASQHDQDVITSLAIEPSNWWWKLARPRDQATWNGDMGSNGPTKLGHMKDWFIRRSCKLCLNVFVEPQPKSRWSDDLLRSSALKNTEFLAIEDGRLGEWRPARTGMRRMVASCHCQHGHFQRHSRLWIKKASTILGTMKDTVIQSIISILNNWEFTIYTYIWVNYTVIFH